jgi:hypothetical protein
MTHKTNILITEEYYLVGCNIGQSSVEVVPSYMALYPSTLHSHLCENLESNILTIVYIISLLF